MVSRWLIPTEPLICQRIPVPTRVEWRISDSACPLSRCGRRDGRARRCDRRRHAPEQVWLLEHPPLYTGGTSAKPQDLHDARFPVFQTGRGGQFTYHGPGQRVAYVMIDLKRRKPDVRAYVNNLEEWIIRTLGRLQRSRRAPHRSHRRVGPPTRQGRWLRGQDRRDRRAAEALGVAARHRHQRRA